MYYYNNMELTEWWVTYPMIINYDKHITANIVTLIGFEPNNNV